MAAMQTRGRFSLHVQGLASYILVDVYPPLNLSFLVKLCALHGVFFLFFVWGD